MSIKTPLRAAAYYRTSGEGQRDNTSIPDQRSDSRHCVDRNGWLFVRDYIDECKSGSQIEGRDAFQQMMRDAANGEFDVVVVSDVTRFGRDGADIIESARTLKRVFGVDLVDTKGTFDTRDPHRILMNFVGAGMAEQDRLRILELMLKGRISKARQGKPWCGLPPIGRRYDPATGDWHITEKGRAIEQTLRRYIAGESLSNLCREFGFPQRSKISEWVRNGQLAGTYTVAFCSPEIGIDVKIPVPAIPQIVTPSLLKKVRLRLQHNRIHNRFDVQKYLLSGFIRCNHCGRALTAQTRDDRVYYRHNREDRCTIASVRGDEAEPPILDFLYGFFLDEPAFNAAVQRAMPSAERRKCLLKEQSEAKNRLMKTDGSIRRLVDAVAAGADVGLLLSKQDELRAEKQAIVQRLQELESQIAALPSLEQLETAAMLTRFRLIEQNMGKDWRALPYEDVKRFLLHLFGDTIRGDGNGIFVGLNDHGTMEVNFKGQVDFHHVIRNGRSISKAFDKEATRLKKEIQSVYERGLREADRELVPETDKLKPYMDN